MKRKKTLPNKNPAPTKDPTGWGKNMPSPAEYQDRKRKGTTRKPKSVKVLTEQELEDISFVGYRQPDFEKFEPVGKAVIYDEAVAIYLANHLKHVKEMTDAKNAAIKDMEAGDLKFTNLVDEFEAVKLAKAQNETKAANAIILLTKRVGELTEALAKLLTEGENLSQSFEDLGNIMADVSQIKNK